MFTIDESDLSWAVSKALLIAGSGLATIIGLAWIAVRKMFSDEPDISEKPASGYVDNAGGLSRKGA